MPASTSRDHKQKRKNGSMWFEDELYATNYFWQMVMLIYFLPLALAYT